MNRQKKSISLEMINHLCKLSHLPLNKKEILLFQPQISEIIDFIKQLSELNLEKIPETYQVTGLCNVTRGDRLEGVSLTQNQCLSQAKGKKNYLFEVKSVFESDEI